MTNTNTTATSTPGFNCRMSVWFQTDRNGRRFAMARGAWTSPPRRVNMAAAEMWVANGCADQVAEPQTMAAMERMAGR